MTLNPDDTLHTVNEAAARLRISRTSVYGLFRKGALRSIKIGARRLVSETACSAFLATVEGAGR